MKIFLDDKRKTPNGYLRVFTAQQAIDVLSTFHVTEISLDHDLGDQNFCNCGNGYDVLLWIEEQVFTKNYCPPIMKIHSDNSSARVKMQLAINAIQKRAKG